MKGQRVWDIQLYNEHPKSRVKIIVTDANIEEGRKDIKYQY